MISSKFAQVVWSGIFKMLKSSNSDIRPIIYYEYQKPSQFR